MTPKSILTVIAIAIILAAGIFLRVHTTVDTTQIGYDEQFYSYYVNKTIEMGVGRYGELVKTYLDFQEKNKEVIVHPLRIFYIVTASFWARLFHMGPLAALHAVAAAFSILYLLLAGVFAWRAGGGRAGTIGTLVFMAFAPLEVWLSQRALVDGIFAFWAAACFWLIWENLSAPNRTGWLLAYTLAMFLMTLTKEYAVFPFIGLCGLIIANRWLRFGIVTPKLLAATVIGPAAAVLLLIYYAGGVGSFFHLYLMVIRKSQILDYALKCQEGPWSRYLLDFLLISPLVLLLAVGRICQLQARDRTELFCAVFLICCYAPMASVDGGMSLRFAAFWDLPICWLAFSELRVIAGRFSPARSPALLAILTIIVFSVGLNQYYWLFVKQSVYQPITRNMLHALNIIKQ